MKDEDIMRYTSFKTPQSDDKILKCLEKWMKEEGPNLGFWAAESLEAKHFIGWFMLIENKFKELEIGYMLDKKFWNKGFATEISSFIIDYAFSLKIDKIIAYSHRYNEVSKKVLKKMGMKEIEILENEIIKYEINRKEYK
jgi:ribosomal-protein-alanine N-acetyltransferase